MNLSHVGTKLLVCGPSGSGKTFLARHLMARWKAASGPAVRWRFIFDVDCQWARALGRKPETSLTACCDSLAKTGLCLYDSGREFGDDLRRAFVCFCDFAFNVSSALNRPKLLVAEEFGDCCPHRGELPPEIRRMFTRGRREELDVLLISHRPSDVHFEVRSQLSAIAAFRFVDRVDLDWLEAYGLDRNLCQTLAPRHYVWKPAGLPPLLKKPVKA